jgi:hypothetical protein
MLVGRLAPDLLHRFSGDKNRPIIRLQTTQRRSGQQALNQQCAARFIGCKQPGAAAPVKETQGGNFGCQFRVRYADLQNQRLAIVSNRWRDVIVRQVGEWRQNGQRPGLCEGVEE